MKKLFLALGVVAVAGFSSCEDVNTFKLDKHQGAYILNQESSKSTISYYNYEREQCTNNYYQQNNDGVSIGSGATTMVVNRNNEYPKGVAYVAVPDANSIEIINLDGFKGESGIDFKKPKDILITGLTTAYISDEDMNVTEFDLSNANVIKSFKLDDQAQKLVSSGKYLYAACKGEAGKSKVYVIDMSTSLFVDTVEVAKQNPVDMVVDTDRKVWVYYNDAEQAIVKLNRDFKTDTISYDPTTNVLVDTTYITNEPTTFELGTKQADYANPLCISRDGRTLYYVYGKLCANSVFIDKENDLSKESIVSGTYENEAFNGIDLDTKTNRLMGLTTSKQLVVLKSADDVWTDEAVYPVGENPIMTTFNY
ncbi:MAG: hypothetical protein N4A71_16495 [Carboxylicivirga sp.]|jgi:hypothetical protein|nr:hypothetical protein [Carboxylicivirga sp.]